MENFIFYAVGPALVLVFLIVLIIFIAYKIFVLK